MRTQRRSTTTCRDIGGGPGRSRRHAIIGVEVGVDMGGQTTGAEHADVLRVESSSLGGHAELRLVGELDLSTVAVFDEALHEVRARHARTIVIDLSGLDFIDSTGLNRLVVALKRQREDGGDIVLRAPTPRTRRILDMVGLTTVFTIT